MTTGYTTRDIVAGAVLRLARKTAGKGVPDDQQRKIYAREAGVTRATVADMDRASTEYGIPLATLTAWFEGTLTILRADGVLIDPPDGEPVPGWRLTTNQILQIVRHVAAQIRSAPPSATA